MDYLTAIILGVVQGLTEFLPVSSSGHLVLGQALLNVDEPGKTVEVTAHFGTLLSVLVYFRQRVWSATLAPFHPDKKHERPLVLYLIVGTIPAVIAYLWLKPQFDQAYASPLFASAMLIVTGFILLMPKWIKPKERELNLRTSLSMGIAQAFAILPGISRSGATITTGIVSGVKPTVAAEFSFLLAVPAILGGVVTEISSFVSLFENDAWGPYAASALSAFLVGLGAIYLVMRSIRGGRFHWFAYYCFLAGLFGVTYFL